MIGADDDYKWIAVNPQDIQRKDPFNRLDVEKILKEETFKREDSPDKEYKTLLIMHALGCYFYEQKRYQEAEVMHRRVIERRKKLLGWEHRATQLSMIWLGHDLKAQDKGLDAYICFQQVVGQELRRLLKPWLDFTKT